MHTLVSGARPLRYDDPVHARASFDPARRIRRRQARLRRVRTPHANFTNISALGSATSTELVEAFSSLLLTHSFYFYSFYSLRRFYLTDRGHSNNEVLACIVKRICALFKNYYYDDSCLLTESQLPWMTSSGVNASEPLFDSSLHYGRISSFFFFLATDIAPQTREGDKQSSTEFITHSVHRLRGVDTQCFEEQLTGTIRHWFSLICIDLLALSETCEDICCAEIEWSGRCRFWRRPEEYTRLDGKCSVVVETKWVKQKD